MCLPAVVAVVEEVALAALEVQDPSMIAVLRHMRIQGLLGTAAGPA